jgi:hypothetical protein
MTEITNITATELRGRLFEILNQVYVHNRVYGIIRHRQLQAVLVKLKDDRFNYQELSVEIALDILNQIEQSFTPEDEKLAEKFGLD